ncbi:hypothetical protein HJFPF1_05642 [Paramyrothecium foliicola]|nr:hypothetical protein HJFPF1_05642 [Paramyrothecium foliicola]
MFERLFARRSQQSSTPAPDPEKKSSPSQCTPRDDPPPYQDLRPKPLRNILDCGRADCPAGRKLAFRPFDEERPRWLLQQISMCPQQHWTATLHVVANSVPALMKDGFYWDERNIDHEQGFVIDGVGWLQHHWKFNSKTYSTRCYVLSDTSKDPQWVGFLEVCAKKGPVLGNFRISDLTPGRIVCGSARNPQNELVYFHDFGSPDSGYNTICDNLPLKGWWPPQRSRPTHGGQQGGASS